MVKGRNRKEEEKLLANLKTEIGIDESVTKDALQRGYKIPIQRIKGEWDDAMIKILADLKK